MTNTFWIALWFKIKKIMIKYLDESCQSLFSVRSSCDLWSVPFKCDFNAIQSVPARHRSDGSRHLGAPSGEQRRPGVAAHATQHLQLGVALSEIARGPHQTYAHPTIKQLILHKALVHRQFLFQWDCTDQSNPLRVWDARRVMRKIYCVCKASINCKLMYILDMHGSLESALLKEERSRP